MGWSEKRRREAIREVVAAVMEQHGCGRTDALQIIANATGNGLNTVQGWVSEGGTRAPPLWPVLDILRYRTGLLSPTPLPGLRRSSP